MRRKIPKKYKKREREREGRESFDVSDAKHTQNTQHKEREKKLKRERGEEIGKKYLIKKGERKKEQKQNESVVINVRLRW